MHTLFIHYTMRQNKIIEIHPAKDIVKVVSFVE